jgi:ribosomal protein S4E
MDVVNIPKTKESFRVLYDVKGRFVLKSLDENEAKVIILFYLVQIIKSQN